MATVDGGGQRPDPSILTSQEHIAHTAPSEPYRVEGDALTSLSYAQFDETPTPVFGQTSWFSC